MKWFFLLLVSVVTSAASIPTPIFYWKMDEGTGTNVTDEISSNKGNVFPGSDWITGFNGSGVGFDGVSGRVVLTNTVCNSADSNVTFCFWYYPSNVAFGKYVFSEGKLAILFASNERLNLTSDNVTFALSDDYPLITNAWNFVAVTRSSDGLGSIRVGDVIKTDQLNTGTPQPGTQNTHLMCKAAASPTLFSAGRIDNFRVYHRILTPEELTSLFEEFHVVTTIEAADCTPAAVQSAINAACCGDTVLVPPCTNNWTTGITVNGRRIKLYAKHILFPGVGRTAITNNLPYSSSDTFLIETSGVVPIEIAGFDIYRSQTTNFSAVNIKVRNRVFRITQCNIYDYRLYGISIGNGSGISGLIDHCYISQLGPYGVSQAIKITGGDVIPPQSIPSQVVGSQWDLPSTMGTTNRVVVEDCTFYHRYAQDAVIELYVGGEATVRYCVGTGFTVGMHGNDSSVRSTKDLEFYNNNLTFLSDGDDARAIVVRGGTGIFCSNVVNGFVGSPSFGIGLQCYRATYTNIFQGYNNGFLSVTNIYDGCSNEFGWPGLDQVGRTGPTVFNLTNVSQPALPLWAWSNLLVTAASTSAFTARLELIYPDTDWPFPYFNATNHIKEGRDFSNALNSAWVPLVYPHPMNTPIAEAAPNITNHYRTRKSPTSSARRR